MARSILIVRLRNRRDCLALRMRARQVSGLLGFDGAGQAQIASQTFELACRAFSSGPRLAEFHLCRQELRIRIVERLPSSAPNTARTAGRNQPGVERLLRRLVQDPAHPTPSAGDGQLAAAPCGRPRAMPGAMPTALRGHASLHFPLPDQSDGLAADDISFAMRKLALLTPLNVFAELERMNSELLALTAASSSSSPNAGSADTHGAEQPRLTA